MPKSKKTGLVPFVSDAKDTKFVPLKMRKKFLYTRREALRTAKRILNDYAHKYLSLEDGNKVSFFTNDMTFKEIMGMYLAFDTMNDVDDIIFESDETSWGFWVIVCFQRQTYPNSDKPKDMPCRWQSPF